MSEPQDPFDHDVEEQDPFEAELTGRLHSMADLEYAPYDLVQRAKGRAEELGVARRRRLVAGATGAFLAGAAAVWLVAITTGAGTGGDPEYATGDGPRGSYVTTSSSSSSTSSSSSSTSTTEPDDPSKPSTTTSSVKGGTVGTIPNTPTQVCDERTGSPNPAHGAYDASYKGFWKSQPPEDAPAYLKVCLSDNTPYVGQQVTVTVTIRDPDQQFGMPECAPLVDWGDKGMTAKNTCASGTEPPESPLDVPDKGSPGEVEVTRTFTYGEVQDAVLRVYAQSGSSPEVERNPYASIVTLELAVHVGEAP